MRHGDAVAEKRRFQCTRYHCGPALTVQLAAPANEKQAERPLVEFRPFSYLCKLPAEPDWLWRGFLSAGALTMLSGHPFRGKSMLVSGLLAALEKGDAFLGLPTTRASAVLVSEEAEGVLRERADSFGLLELASEYVSRSSGVFAVDWHELIAEATERALDKQHRLLIVDTFPGLAGLQDEQENDAGAIGERLRPLQAAAGEGLSVLFLHHMNGQSQPRGSKAFRGVVDTSIRLFRDDSSSSFSLKTESRYPTATPDQLGAKLDMRKSLWCYRRLDSSARVSPKRGPATDTRLHTAIAEAGSAGITYGELNEIDSLSEHMAKRRLPDWYQDGKVDHRGAGTRTDPYRWFIPDSG